MRWLLIVLLILLLGLQTRLWVGEGSLAHKAELDNQLEDQRRVNIQLRERNAFIAKEVESLKTNLDSIEAKSTKRSGNDKGRRSVLFGHGSRDCRPETD